MHKALIPKVRPVTERGQIRRTKVYNKYPIIVAVTYRVASVLAAPIFRLMSLYLPDRIKDSLHDQLVLPNY